jgi:hypothetical protein
MRKSLLTLAVVAASALFATTTQSARAVFEMTLATGAATQTVIDNGAGDLDSRVGQISFSGSIGNFSTVITAGTSNSPGSNGLAILQTHNIAVRETTASRQTLTITMGDTGFTVPTGTNLQLGSSFSGTFLSPVAGESVSFQSYADASNAQFGKSVTSGQHAATLANGSPAPVGFTTADRTAAFSSTGPYSLTDVTVINLSANGQANVAGTSSVTIPGGTGIPEPASLSLLGMGVAALFSTRRRKA